MSIQNIIENWQKVVQTSDNLSSAFVIFFQCHLREELSSFIVVRQASRKGRLHPVVDVGVVIDVWSKKNRKCFNL